MSIDSTLFGWLLESDPALRWQVERDVVGEPPAVWEATRARTATKGFGAALYPSRHRYSVLVALDHFREVALLEGTSR